MTHNAAITARIITDRTVYTPAINTETEAVNAAEKGVADYLELHFADEVTCGHGKNFDDAAAKIVEDVMCELHDEDRFAGIETEWRGWSNVALDITARAGKTLQDLHSGKEIFENVHICTECGDDAYEENSWSAMMVKL